MRFHLKDKLFLSSPSVFKRTQKYSDAPFREEPKENSIVNPISSKIVPYQAEPKTAERSWIAKLKAGKTVEKRDPAYKTLAQVKSGGDTKQTETIQKAWKIEFGITLLL